MLNPNHPVPIILVQTALPNQQYAMPRYFCGKSIKEKSSYTDMLCHFNQAPREDGYSPSKLFHGRRMRSHLPCLNNTVDVDKGKAARELKDMVVKNATKTHKPLKPLNIRELYYRRHFNGKKTLRIESLYEVIKVRKNGES